MNYISTRGETAPMSFSNAVLSGLAPDGGLLVPEEFPNTEYLLGAPAMSYAACAWHVMKPYVDIPEEIMRPLLNEAYSCFASEDPAPLVDVGGTAVLELFHGPTLAFKDFALQFLGRVFQHLLRESGGTLNLLGSTSGDTGSAAIHAVRGLHGVQIFMMHPAGRTSRLQALQMTTVQDPNVFNIAVDGTFDDCQSLMKTLFAEVPFKEKYRLGAVNSVNWARILAQVVYYWHAGLAALRRDGSRPLRFVVPTGNFGNVLAAYYASRMGLPIAELCVATNENDILHRFFQSGTYQSGQVVASASPSMDIQIASNFERFLFHACGEDTARIRTLMATFRATGSITPGGHLAMFRSARTSSQDALAAVHECWANHRYLLDPHTACAWKAIQDNPAPHLNTICVATAHPAKFPEAVFQATGITPVHPSLDALAHLPVRCDAMPADAELLRAYITERCRPD